jgi:poly(A)-specific ribonuclease
LHEEAPHEAGYDSYLTARIIILLSAKLEASGTYLSEDDGGGVSLTADGQGPIQTGLAALISDSSALSFKDQRQKTLMPPLESDFWKVYGNRLRVFGTDERVLDLDPTRSV